MSPHNNIRTYILFALLCGLLVSRALASPLIIHHPELQHELISTSELVRIYAMQKRVWSDNTPVKVFVLPNNSDLHKAFVKDYLKMQPYQLDRLWHRLVFSGTGSKPQEVETVKKMLEKIRNTPGAIGYIDSSMLDQVDVTMTTGIEP